MTISAEECAREVLDVVPQVMREIRSVMRSNRTEGLSVPQFRTLIFVHRHGGASLSEVADHIGVTLPSMSKLVDGLVGRGLVNREIDAGDRRRVMLTLTPEGVAILQRASSVTRQSLAERLTALDDSDRMTVVQAMQALRTVFATQQETEANRER